MTRPRTTVYGVVLASGRVTYGAAGQLTFLVKDGRDRSALSRPLVTSRQIGTAVGRLGILARDLDNDTIVTWLLVVVKAPPAQHILLLNDLTQLLVSLQLRRRALAAKGHLLRALR